MRDRKTLTAALGAWLTVLVAQAAVLGASRVMAVENIAVRRVSQVSDLSADPPAAGAFRVHLIDVATGLSVLVQGHDFNLLFDGGSRDDKGKITAHANKSRLLAYLFAAIGPSGGAECVPDGDDWPESDGSERTIQHVVLSHPHDDHDRMLPDVLSCYRVDHVWDSGVVNPTATHAAFVQAVADEPEVTYHTAADLPESRTVTIKDSSIVFPETVQWTTFADGDEQILGDGAHFTILRADPIPHKTDYNRNSLVLRVDLGERSLLLTGDTESGARKPPSEPPGFAEEDLLENHRDELRVDILQVGHHGSKTSSRHAFIKAVDPHWALIGSGPFKYSGVTLPDAEIIEELTDAGAVVLRTDLNDGHCPVADRIGIDTEPPAGGCDNFVLEITP